MKMSQRIAEAHKLNQRIKDLLDPINEKLVEILEDDSAHLTLQPGDGWCVSYQDRGYGTVHNACIGFLTPKELDKLLSMSKDNLLETLENLGI